MIYVTEQGKQDLKALRTTTVVYVAGILFSCCLISLIVYLDPEATAVYWVKDIGHFLWLILQFMFGITIYYCIKHMFTRMK